MRDFTRISRVITPATPAFAGQGAFDLVSLASVKVELGLADTSKDSNLLVWITQASNSAARFCNRVFPIETFQEQLYPPRDFYPPVAIGGTEPLQLRRYPIAGVPCVAGTQPPLAPALSAVSGGVLAASRVYVVITYVTAQGETAISGETNLALAADQLLTVASPLMDTQNLAVGWNVYVGTKSGQEILQNSSPLSIGTSWTEPVSGLISSGTAIPSFVSVVENLIPLAEGIDFLVDYENGEMTRLDVNAWPKRWPAWPIQVQYQAGYSLTDPDLSDAQDAVTRMVKGRYFSQTRDPALRQENFEGVYSATYWFASGPGASEGDLPPDIQSKLQRYRMPVVG